MYIQNDFTTVFGQSIHLHQWEPCLVDPIRQLLWNEVPSGQIPLFEELMFSCIGLLVFDEVVAQSLQEILIAHLLPDHSDNCTSFILTDGVENFIYLLRPLNGDADRVAGLETVQIECSTGDGACEWVQVFEFRE